MRTRLAFLIMLGLLASSSIARAAVPSEFTVQGVLRNGAGTLQSTPVDVSVSLFDASSTGTKLAGETWDDRARTFLDRCLAARDGASSPLRDPV